MDPAPDLLSLVHAIGRGQRDVAERILTAHPDLARATIQRPQEFFFEDCSAQMYAADTALHAAAFAYDTDIARRLVASGANVRARNRRGAEPLHAAIIGGPSSPHWNPDRQVAVIRYLVSVGADPNARASGGVSPLQRAVRNRCSAAVAALLELGSDPSLANDSGSVAADLATWTTGRGGTGSPEARAEQQKIISLLTDVSG